MALPCLRVLFPEEKSESEMTKVFVSGCYDILHGGHVQFFRDARALGDHLTVCFASDATIRAYKGREPAMPQEHRRAVLEACRYVDAVVMGDDKPAEAAWVDFWEPLKLSNADILAVTADDSNADEKRALLWQARPELEARLVVLPKTCDLPPLSTTDIRERIVDWTHCKAYRVGDVMAEGDISETIIAAGTCEEKA